MAYQLLTKVGAHLEDQLARKDKKKAKKVKGKIDLLIESKVELMLPSIILDRLNYVFKDCSDLDQ